MSGGILFDALLKTLNQEVQGLGSRKDPPALNTTQKQSFLPSAVFLRFQIYPRHAWYQLNPPVARERLNSQVSVGLCVLKKEHGGLSVVPRIILAYLPELQTHIWWIQQYPLQNFSDVCALIPNVFVTMSDDCFVKCADSAAAGKSLFPYWVRFGCLLMWEKIKRLFFLYFFSLFPVRRHWATIRPDIRGGTEKMTRHSVVFTPRT